MPRAFYLCARQGAAKIHAAREHLTIAGRPVPDLPVRSAIQLVFVATLIAAAWLGNDRKDIYVPNYVGGNRGTEEISGLLARNVTPSHQEG